MQKYQRFYLLISWISVLLLVSFLLSQWTQASVATWYPQLTISPLTPPSPVFGIVWTILYIMIAYVGFLLYSRPTKKNIKHLFMIQLIFNWCWMPLFFNWHQIGASLLLILLITTLVGLFIYKTFKHHRKICWFMIPYFFWLMFASYLNFYIWIFN